MTDLHDLSAEALTKAYRARQLSPVEATRAALARMERWESKINAMYIVDADGALAQAKASEARWGAGATLSALHSEKGSPGAARHRIGRSHAQPR
jgi:aspartyl-tRNA(Asn)/glutamyl-tRNA(Gln) amidotransferase subunit A